jgi:hypothetical protein
MHLILETFVETLVGMLAPGLKRELTLVTFMARDFRSPLIHKIGIDSLMLLSQETR